MICIYNKPRDDEQKAIEWISEYFLKNNKTGCVGCGKKKENRCKVLTERKYRAKQCPKLLKKSLVPVEDGSVQDNIDGIKCTVKLINDSEIDYYLKKGWAMDASLIYKAEKEQIEALEVPVKDEDNKTSMAPVDETENNNPEDDVEVDLEVVTIQKLRKMCSERGIESYKKTKKELIELLTFGE